MRTGRPGGGREEHEEGQKKMDRRSRKRTGGAGEAEGGQEG